MKTHFAKFARWTALIAVSVLATGHDGHAQDRDDENDRDRPVVRILVPRDAPSIQQAVDICPNASPCRVVVRGGVYEEEVTVSGKIVELIGLNRPQIVAPIPERVPDIDLSAGLINALADADLTVRGFNLIGGEAAIWAYDRALPARRVAVKDTLIQLSGRGIQIADAEVLVSNSSIHGTLYHGMFFKSPSMLSVVSSSVLESAFGAGLYLIDSHPDEPTGSLCSNNLNNTGNVIHHNFFSGHAQGGVYISNSSACLALNGFETNNIGGIISFDSNLDVVGNTIIHTLPDSNGLYGDAIIAAPWISESDIEVVAGLISDARAGIYNFGSFVSLENVPIRCAAIDGGLVAENAETGQISPPVVFPPSPAIPPEPLSAEFDDLGGNACGCPAADDVCLASGPGLEPPTPLAE